jgi:two-component system, response regulator
MKVGDISIFNPDPAVSESHSPDSANSPDSDIFFFARKAANSLLGNGVFTPLKAPNGLGRITSAMEGQLGIESAAEALGAERKIIAPNFSSRFSPDEFEQILEWASLGTAHSRQNLACFNQHQLKLKANPATRQRLAEFSQWADSVVFNAPEKIALRLSRAISSDYQAELSQLLSEAQCHFNPDEIVRIASVVLTVNERIDINTPSPIRILVVEDNPDDQELLLRQLSKAKLSDHVMFISDGRQALDLIENVMVLSKTGLIAVFLDLHLPGIGGLDLLRRLRRQPGAESFPVIAMTSSNDPNDLEECQKLNVTSFVQKPVTYQSFSHAIANIFHSV